jgi:hypothetical protein
VASARLSGERDQVRRREAHADRDRGAAVRAAIVAILVLVPIAPVEPQARGVVLARAVATPVVTLSLAQGVLALAIELDAGAPIQRREGPVVEEELDAGERHVPHVEGAVLGFDAEARLLRVRPERAKEPHGRVGCERAGEGN